MQQCGPIDWEMLTRTEKSVCLFINIHNNADNCTPFLQTLITVVVVIFFFVVVVFVFSCSTLFLAFFFFLARSFV